MKLRQVFMILLFASVYVSGFPSMAAPAQESYNDRPDIFQINPQRTEFDANWESIKKAQLIFVAQLLELYPEKQLYFLARDGEYLFDLAQLATKGTSDFNRIHLINVSRSNMRDRNFVVYLDQQGISEQSLLAGKEIILIDSGYNGSIPDHIKFQFSDQASRNIQSQFILSKDPKIPSSRSFLLFLNKNAHQLNPKNSTELKENLLAYEHLEKHNRRSTHFKKINGTYHPMSPVKDPKAESSSRVDKIIASMQASENVAVDPEKSLERRADLLADWNLSSSQNFFIETRKMFKKIRQSLITENYQDLQSLRSGMLMVKSENTRNQIFDSYLLDAHDILKSQGVKLKINKVDLLRTTLSRKAPMCRSIY